MLSFPLSARGVGHVVPILEIYGEYVVSMGYVYLLTNPSFREDWVKIGKTRRPVNVRSAELDNTAVPLPFEVYATIKTE